MKNLNEIQMKNLSSNENSTECISPLMINNNDQTKQLTIRKKELIKNRKSINFFLLSIYFFIFY